MLFPFTSSTLHSSLNVKLFDNILSSDPFITVIFPLITFNSLIFLFEMFSSLKLGVLVLVMIEHLVLVKKTFRIKK